MNYIGKTWPCEILSVGISDDIIWHGHVVDSAARNKFKYDRD